MTELRTSYGQPACCRTCSRSGRVSYPVWERGEKIVKFDCKQCGYLVDGRDICIKWIEEPLPEDCP